VKTPRNRVITFRLTENEYLRLKSACGVDQRSVSEVARHSILQWAQEVVPRPAMDERLGEISERLGALVGMLNKRARK
jgi:hypothetical protein